MMLVWSEVDRKMPCILSIIAFKELLKNYVSCKPVFTKTKNYACHRRDISANTGGPKEKHKCFLFKSV